MTTKDKDLVLIGEIGKPHGIRGEVSVTYHGDSPFLLNEVRRVYLRPRTRAKRPPRSRVMQVAGWREHKERVLVRFKGVDDRNGAEAIRGHEVLVQADDLPELDDHEVYLYEIEGLTVLLEDGTELGEIDAITFPGGQELWSILTEDGTEVLFPVQEDFVPGVDLDEGTVTIAPPDGLLDLYLGAKESDVE